MRRTLKQVQMRKDLSLEVLKTVENLSTKCDAWLRTPHENFISRLLVAHGGDRDPSLTSRIRYLRRVVSAAGCARSIARYLCYFGVVLVGSASSKGPHCVCCGCYCCASDVPGKNRLLSYSRSTTGVVGASAACGRCAWIEMDSGRRNLA